MEQRIKNIINILDDKKAKDIQAIDLKGKNYIVDVVIIATTLNSKHGMALLDYLRKGLKPSGEEFLRVEENDEWTMIDFGDIFIHLMSEDYRSKYAIEEFLSKQFAI